MLCLGSGAKTRAAGDRNAQKLILGIGLLTGRRGGAAPLRRGRERGGAAARLRLLCRVFPPPTLSRLT